MSNIKWAAIQPLTGGMYLGAEEAIGHPAEWILSFDGLLATKRNKEGKLTAVANEYHLMQYLDKHGRKPPYYVIHSAMFDIDVDNLNPRITLNDIECKPDYDDLDIVIGLPVCSGLSMATRAGKKTLDSRNCNMQWMAKYTLVVIKPKVYIFENAPTFMGSRGEELRIWFEEMAMHNGYSVLYYKTDTIYHDNCQKRPRTFIIFVRHNNDSDAMQVPNLLSYEHNTVSIKEFLKRIPEGLTQMQPLPTKTYNKYVLDWINERYGDKWKEMINGSIMDWINKNKLIDDLIAYVKQSPKYSLADQEKTLKYFNHIKHKRSLGLNYYGDDIQYVKDKLPAIQFRSMPNMLHISENRIYSIREYLSFMGMPFDFELYGDSSNIPKIGQNVPVGTMKFITNEVIDKILNHWDDPREVGQNVVYQNNIYQRVMIA